MVPGILLSLCVVVLSGPLKGKHGTAVDYNDHVYTVSFIVDFLGMPAEVKEKVHETNLRECDK